MKPGHKSKFVERICGGGYGAPLAPVPAATPVVPRPARSLSDLALDHSAVLCSNPPGISISFRGGLIFENALLSRLRWKQPHGNGYRLAALPVTDEVFHWIERRWNLDPSQYVLEEAFLIDNAKLAKNFSDKMQGMEEQRRNLGAAFNAYQNAKAGDYEKERGLKYYRRMNFTNTGLSLVQISAMFHGCTHSVADSLALRGAKDLRRTDGGFFGAGSYFTNMAGYSCGFASGLLTGAESPKNDRGQFVVMLCLLVTGNTYVISRETDYDKPDSYNKLSVSTFHYAYPVQCEDDLKSRKDKALKGGFDSHYIPINTNACNYQCAPGIDLADADECVIKEEAQVYPLARLHFRSRADAIASPLSLMAEVTEKEESGRGRFERELGVLNLGLREREDSLRRLFAQDPQSDLVTDPHVDLIDVFANINLFAPSEDQSWQHVRGHILFKKHVTAHGNDMFLHDDHQCERKKVAYSITHTTLSAFRKNFSLFSCGVLDELPMSNAVIAGGSVLAGLLVRGDEKEIRESFHGYDDSDIDLFFYDLTPEAAIEKICQIYELLRRQGDVTVTRTKLAITFQQDYPRRAIQVVLRIYKSPCEVLVGFDLDSCCLAFDGSHVWATARSRRALNGMMNVVDPSRQSLTYESRLFKYTFRGFAVVVPGFDKSQVSFDLLDKPVAETHGMARLLLLESSVRRTVLVARRSAWSGVPCVSDRRLVDEAESYDNSSHSDYSGYAAKTRPGFHPYGSASLFLKGAIDKENGRVPCVVARNTLKPILDVGPTGEVEMEIWTTAREEELFPNQRRKHDPAQNPEDKWVESIEFVCSLSQTITFLVDNPGRQMVGSFHPTDRDFFEGIYSSCND